MDYGPWAPAAPGTHGGETAIGCRPRGRDRRGPTAEAELQWRLLKEQAAEAASFHEFGLLVQAAHADSRLRQPYAFSSHWVLGFDAHTGQPPDVEVAIAPAHDGLPYRVRKFLHRGRPGHLRPRHLRPAQPTHRLPWLARQQ